MSTWRCITSPHLLLIRADRSLLPAALGLLAALLCLAGTLPAPAQSFPLPPWYFYGSGNGSTWGGSSTSPDNAQLSVTLWPPPVVNQYGTAIATGSTDLLQITPLTTYTFAFSAMFSGPGSVQALMVDGVGTITNISVLSMLRYTNSFTTGTPDDPHVGRNLNVMFLLNRFNYLGTANAYFTDIQFYVNIARPTLSHRVPAPGILQLLWPTNFYWYIPQQTTNLDAASWEDMTNLPTTQGTRFLIQVNADPDQHFFRLRQP